MAAGGFNRAALAKSEGKGKKWRRLSASEGERGGGMDGRRECCGKGKYGRRKRERSELARQEWSVKKGEVEEKMRQGARE